jgi:hypothetical protein
MTSRYVASLAMAGMLVATLAQARADPSEDAPGSLAAPSGGQVVDTNPADLRAQEHAPPPMEAPSAETHTTHAHPGHFARAGSAAQGGAGHAHHARHHRARAHRGG